MTDDNRRRNVADELARAELSLRAATALVQLGLHADGVSRAYYGVYHLLRALLYARGVEPRTHAGAIHLFNTELVRQGAMPSTHNRLIGGLQRARELADYDAAVTFSAEDASVFLADAQTFDLDARAFLAREGFA